ncbi:MAG: hypothetical protein IID61_18845 [SAR324 cluster bacterium]|nr:hypothetical protein [SAR324 cluster bacterium]
MATGAAGAPPIAVNSLVVTGVASLSTVRAGAAYIGGNLAESQVNKGVSNGYASLDGSGDVPDAQIPNLNASKITGGVLDEARVPFEGPGPIGSTTPGTGKFSTIDVTSSPSGTPGANRIYKESICKAWINFDGFAVTSGNNLTGVRDFFNVSGVVKEATGQPSIYWDRDFANDNYAISFGLGSGLGAGANAYAEIRILTANRIVLKTIDINGGAQEDVAIVCVMAMGNQA